MKTRAVLVVAAALVSGACATMIPVAPHVAVGGFGALKSGSDGRDSEKGVGGHVVAGPRIGQTSLLGLLGFTRLSFTGGHDNIISAGAQVRQRFGLPLAPNPWIGLEGTWMRTGGPESVANGSLPCGPNGAGAPTADPGCGAAVAGGAAGSGAGPPTGGARRRFHIRERTPNGSVRRSRGRQRSRRARCVAAS